MRKTKYPFQVGNHLNWSKARQVMLLLKVVKHNLSLEQTERLFPIMYKTDCFVVNAGVGEIVFLHAFPLPDIQCYWYRLRHPYPDKVIWNHCRINRRKPKNIFYFCFLKSLSDKEEKTNIFYFYFWNPDKDQIYSISRYMRELSYSAYTGLNNTTELVCFWTSIRMDWLMIMI